MHVPAGYAAVGRSAVIRFALLAAPRSAGPFDDLIKALHLPPQEQNGTPVQVHPVEFQVYDGIDGSVIVGGSRCPLVWIPKWVMERFLDSGVIDMHTEDVKETFHRGG